MTWYELDHARLVLEHLRVSARYPNFSLGRAKARNLYWLGELVVKIDKVTPPPFKIRVEYPETFPVDYPDVYILSPDLPADHVGHVWHRWPTSGTICYVKPKEWQLGTTADEVISKCEDWYFNYIAVLSGLIQEMPEIGRARVESQ